MDFSGAARAGRKIWLARCEARGGTLRVEDCLPAAELPGGGTERGAAIAALVTFLAGQGECAAGFDFPVALARPLMPGGGYPAFLRHFAERYPDAEAFRAHCRALGSERTLKRRTDLETRTPFAAHNLRLYRQTFHGIRDVIAPLVLRAGARVLPNQSPRAGRPWLLETCPASALKQRKLHSPAYKGRQPAQRQRRAELLQALADWGLRIESGLRERLVADAEADGLDALIAAHVTWRAVTSPRLMEPAADAQYRLEGYVYCWQQA